MKKGGAFGLVGFILGAVGTVVSVTAIVFSALSLVFLKRGASRPRIR